MTTWLDRDPRWAGIREESICVNGQPVRVLRAEARGRANDPPEREPQLLVHGLGGSSANWIDVIAPLTAYGPVVAVDLPGFGGTPVPTGGSARIRANAAFVSAAARTLGWDTFALHGNSMGGLIAALVAARHPDRVSRLVLVSPAIPPATPASLIPPSRARILGVLPMALPVVGPALAGYAMSQPVGTTESPGRMDPQVLLQLLFADPRVLRPSLLQALAVDAAIAELQTPASRARAMVEATRSLTAMWLDPRMTHAAVRSIAAPTLLIGGEMDALVPAKVVRGVGRLRQDWTTWIARGMGHVLMLEDPDRYVHEVGQWRSRHAARPETIDLHDPDEVPVRTRALDGMAAAR